MRIIFGCVDYRLQRSAISTRAVILLTALIMTSCTGSAKQSQDTQFSSTANTSLVPANSLAVPNIVTQLGSSNLIDKYRFPENLDPDLRYMFYLHGKIIEDQGLPAYSPEFGEYQYQEILTALDSNGFIVISEMRTQDTNAGDYAGKVVEQVTQLLDSGVKPESITVVGASKGAAITASISNLLSNPEVNYVLLGACYQPMIDSWEEQGLSLYGNILSIYDDADDSATSCQALYDFSAGVGLGEHEEIMLQVGKGHGILYQPLPEWVEPTLQWAAREN